MPQPKKITWRKTKRQSCEQYIKARIEANRKRVAESNDAPTLEQEKGAA